MFTIVAFLPEEIKVFFKLIIWIWIIEMASEGESAHEFGALNTLLLVVVLSLCILSAYLIKQNSFYYLPESGAAM